jgi:hypothetical protein
MLPPASPPAGPVATAAPLQAVVDGPLVCLSGPAGILGVNPRTGLEVFRGAWPAAALQGAAAKAPTPAATPESDLARWGAPGLAQPGYGMTFQIARPGRSVDLGLAGGGLVAGDGVLYATVTPTRVVALESEDKRQ